MVAGDRPFVWVPKDNEIAVSFVAFLPMDIIPDITLPPSSPAVTNKSYTRLAQPHASRWQQYPRTEILSISDCPQRLFHPGWSILASSPQCCSNVAETLTKDSPFAFL